MEEMNLRLTKMMEEMNKTMNKICENLEKLNKKLDSWFIIVNQPNIVINFILNKN